MKYFLSLILVFLSSVTYGANITLYDVTLNDLLPHEQSNLLQASSPSHMSVVSGSYTRYDTMDNLQDMSDFYSTKVSLDRTLGYTFSFRLRVVQNIHNYSSRGPVNITLWSNDKSGVILYFRTDEIMAVEATYGTPKIQSESYSTTSFIDYDLTVINNSYVLYGNGSEILSGTLDNFVDYYLDQGYNPAYPFLRIGDSTSGSSGIVDIVNMSLSGDGATIIPDPVPEPSSLILLLLPITSFYFRLKKGK